MKRIPWRNEANWFNTYNKQGYTLERHPRKKQKVGKTELNYDTDGINSGKTGESFVFKESKSKSFKELIKSLTPTCDSSESGDDFEKAFQPLIINSYMILGDTRWTDRKWKTNNAGQISYFLFIWLLTWTSNGKNTWSSGI